MCINFANVLIALWCHQLQTKKFKLHYHYGKNWHDDSQLNYTPTTTPKDYKKIECAIAKKNYNLIEEADFLEQLHIGDDWINNLGNLVYNFYFLLQ